MNERRGYTSDLTDEQWARLEPLLQRPAHHGGRPRTYPLREIVNGLFYYVKNGCGWRDLPHDLPPWESVYDHFRRWKSDGLLEHVHACLREEVRAAEGREATPSAAVVDAQSVRTAEKRGAATATTPASACRAASDTCASTRSG